MVGSTPIASGRQNDEGDGICGHGVGDTERVERREAERAFIVVPLCGGGRHSQAKPPPPSRPPQTPPSRLRKIVADTRLAVSPPIVSSLHLIVLLPVLLSGCGC
jgi:hypothetical protein